MPDCPIDLTNINPEDYEHIEVDLQQELPDAVKDCEKSIREDNPDMDRSTAIAICRDQLDMQDDGGCPSGQIMVNGECVPIEDTEIVPPLDLSLPSPYHLAEFQPDAIERVEEDDDTVRYTNIKLLGPGRWTDSNSREMVLYSPEGIQNLEVDPDNSVHIFHDSDNEVSRVGRIDPDSTESAENGVFADIVFDTSTAAGEFADENMKATLESGGAKGFGGPSVEIPKDGQKVEFNHELGLPELKAGRISDLGLVKNPGSKDVHFARQTAHASVALADGSGQSVMRPDAIVRGMTDATVAADALLAQFDVDVDDLGLAGDRDLADVPVAELVSLIAEAYGADPAELMSALEPFLDGEEGGEEEVENQDPEDEDPEDEPPEDEPPEDPEEEDDVDIDIDAEQVTALEERVTALEDMMDSMLASSDLEEELEDLADAESVGELESALEDAEKRLASLEEEPKNAKTLADAGGDGEGEAVGPISPIEPSRSY